MSPARIRTRLRSDYMKKIYVKFVDKETPSKYSLDAQRLKRLIFIVRVDVDLAAASSDFHSD